MPPDTPRALEPPLSDKDAAGLATDGNPPEAIDQAVDVPTHPQHHVLTPTVLYRIEWEDTKTGRRLNFESDTPFPSLEVATEKISEFTSTLEDTAEKPPLEVVVEVDGIANKSGKRPWSTEGNQEQPNVPRPLNFDDVAISSVGRTTLIINSQPLLKALQDIVTYFPPKSLRGDSVEIVEPYAVLVHHLQQLDAKLKQLETSEEKNSDLYNHLTALLNFLERNIGKSVQSCQDKLSKPVPVITFENLWMLFKPGEDVYIFNWNNIIEAPLFAGVLLSLLRYEPNAEEQRAGKKPGLHIEVWTLQYDGNIVSRSANTVSYIEWFGGEREVTSLPVYPCRFRDVLDSGETRRKLETRGEKLYQFHRAEPKHMWFDGQPLAKSKQNYSGAVIFDAATVLKENYWRTDEFFKWYFLTTELGVNTADDNINGEPGQFQYRTYQSIKVRECESLPTPHHYFLLFPMLPGFSVVDKLWRTFPFDRLTDVKTEDLAMASLVISEETSDIVQAVCHAQSHPFQVEYIWSKGEGQIILLHGPPGVGKTYTVECIAQATGRPLITLAMADLMFGAEVEVEEVLLRWFGWAEKWGAILLLDEADIFLERRAQGDIKRNGIVSVFLRRMEYFRGILFLTTNRIGHIDDAFISRVTVVLYYKYLTDDMRKKIWNGFFEKLKRDMASNDLTNKKGTRRIEINKYARDYVLNDREVKELEWNGREIRNALQTAISLASYKAPKEGKPLDSVIEVEEDHFRSVVQMSKKFKKYLTDVSNKDEKERARQRYDRNDSD